MKRDDVLALIQSHRNGLRQLGIKSLDLFGSVARNEAHLESDVDFLVEFEQSHSLFQLLRVQHYLEDILRCLLFPNSRLGMPLAAQASPVGELSPDPRVLQAPRVLSRRGTTQALQPGKKVAYSHT